LSVNFLLRAIASLVISLADGTCGELKFDFLCTIHLSYTDF
jgi:hypothetical protein